MTLTLDLAIDLLVASFIVGPKSSDLVFGRKLWILPKIKKRGRNFRVVKFRVIARVLLFVTRKKFKNYDLSERRNLKERKILARKVKTTSQGTITWRLKVWQFTFFTGRGPINPSRFYLGRKFWTLHRRISFEGQFRSKSTDFCLFYQLSFVPHSKIKSTGSTSKLVESIFSEKK